MNAKTKKWLKFTVRWGIALFGVIYVLKNISLHDQVIIPNPVDGRPQYVTLALRQGDNYFVVDPETGKQQAVKESTLLTRGERNRVDIVEQGKRQSVELLAMKVTPGLPRHRWPLLVTTPRGFFAKYFDSPLITPARLVDPSLVVDQPWRVNVEYPLIDAGLGTMVRQADAKFLWASILIFPVTYLLTSYRWYLLLGALSIKMSAARAFVINMVGAFYNTFLPGSTGGDVAKAYYAARQNPGQRTRAVMSVLVDRVIGLLALVLLGGSMAWYQYSQIGNPHDATAHACLRVAVGSGVILVGTLVGLTVFYTPFLRRISGLGWLITKLPMQRQLLKAIEVMEIYRQRPMLVLWALLITLPVHITVVLSAMFAGQALGLPIRPTFYWVVVPVCVLSGSLPVSPQGAGVMEFFAILLTRREGASVSQAVALTMSIRIVQILWNCAGGYFVLRGHFHAPTEKEAAELNEPDAKMSEAGAT